MPNVSMRKKKALYEHFWFDPRERQVSYFYKDDRSGYKPPTDTENLLVTMCITKYYVAMKVVSMAT
jgi:hypothetical protein